MNYGFRTGEIMGIVQAQIRISNPENPASAVKSLC